VTVAEPIHLTKDDGKALLGELKKACGSGGALKVIKDREGRPALALEIQGDHADTVTAALLERGYAAKRAGG
jgi:translation initiation factor 1